MCWRFVATTRTPFAVLARVVMGTDLNHVAFVVGNREIIGSSSSSSCSVDRSSTSIHGLNRARSTRFLRRVTGEHHGEHVYVAPVINGAG